MKYLYLVPTERTRYIDPKLPPLPLATLIESPAIDAVGVCRGALSVFTELLASCASSSSMTTSTNEKMYGDIIVMNLKFPIHSTGITVLLMELGSGLKTYLIVWTREVGNSNITQAGCANLRISAAQVGEAIPLWAFTGGVLTLAVLAG